MASWGAQFARTVAERSEGQSDFALDLIDLLNQKAAEFNEEAKGSRFPVEVKTQGEDVQVGNGYKTAAAISTVLPGTIFVRVSQQRGDHGFEATLHNTANGFESEGLPSECTDPAGLAEWMIHEIFEP